MGPHPTCARLSWDATAVRVGQSSTHLKLTPAAHIPHSEVFCPSAADVESGASPPCGARAQGTLAPELATIK